MNLYFEIEEQEVTYDDVDEITRDIAGGGTMDKGEIIDVYHDVAKDIIYTAIDNSEEEFTKEEEQDILDENLEEIKEELAEDLLEAVREELANMLENIENAIDELN